MRLKNSSTLYFFYLIIFFYSIPTFAQIPSTIKKIAISGNQVFTSKNILADFQPQVDAIFDSSKVESSIKKLLKRYRDTGYLQTQIKWNWLTPDRALTVTIDEKKRTKVSEVRLVSNNSIRTDHILKAMDTRPGAIFRESVFLQDIDRVLRIYENNGFPYCKVHPENFEFFEDGALLNFSLRISEGSLARIESIRIVGNTITRANVIRRAMRLRIGDVYNQEKVDEAERRLIRLGFFSDVQPIQLLQGTFKSDAILLVRVSEGKTSRINGAVGYVPKSEQHDGYLTGKIDFSFQNLVGTGRRVVVQWNRKDPYSSFARFGYREPWILGSPLAVGADLQQSIQDSLYTKRDAQLVLEMPISETLTGELQFATEEVIPGTQTNNPIDHSSKTFTGGSLRRDSRNSLYNPDRGSFYFIAANYGKRKYRNTNPDQPDKENASEIILTSRIERYFPTFRRQTIALNLNGAIISSSEDVIPVHEQFKLGGTQNLRGYKEDQFRGERVGWSNLEYRFLLTRQSRFFLFLDSGFYYYKQYVDETIESVQKWKVGYGLGLRVSSRIGLIGIDYGLGEGDGVLDGKIHFGLEETF